MSKKQLNVEAITNELRGASLFFSRPSHNAPTEEIPAATESPRSSEQPQQTVTKLVESEAIPHASTPASTIAATDDDLIDRIRKTVKSPGKEVSFVRLTLEEKHQLADVVYTYKRQGVKTSENEINRIALIFLLEDYKENGANSLLVKVIDALLA